MPTGAGTGDPQVSGSTKQLLSVQGVLRGVSCQKPWGQVSLLCWAQESGSLGRASLTPEHLAQGSPPCPRVQRASWAPGSRGNRLPFPSLSQG